MAGSITTEATFRTRSYTDAFVLYTQDNVDAVKAFVAKHDGKHGVVVYTRDSRGLKITIVCPENCVHFSNLILRPGTALVYYSRGQYLGLMTPEAIVKEYVAKGEEVSPPAVEKD